MSDDAYVAVELDDKNGWWVQGPGYPIAYVQTTFTTEAEAILVARSMSRAYRFGVTAAQEKMQQALGVKQ